MLFPVLSLFCHVPSSALQVWRKINVTTRLCSACICFKQCTSLFRTKNSPYKSVILFFEYHCLNWLFLPSLLTFLLSLGHILWLFKMLVSSRTHYHLSFCFFLFFKYMFRSLILHFCFSFIPLLRLFKFKVLHCVSDFLSYGIQAIFPAAFSLRVFWPLKLQFRIRLSGISCFGMQKLYSIHTYDI